MIALTQEKREELISKVSNFLSSNTFVRDTLERKVYEIALASLTAEPIEYLTWHQGCRAPDDCEEYTVVADKGDKSCDGSDAFPVYTAPPVPEIKLSLLQSRDLESLIRFNETCEDGEGYDLSKDKMDRLVELGVVRKIKGGIREITALGQMYIDINRKDSPSEFLMTETDRAAAFNQHLKRLNGFGE